MNHDPATHDSIDHKTIDHVSIDRCDLSTAAWGVSLSPDSGRMGE